MFPPGLTCATAAWEFLFQGQFPLLCSWNWCPCVEGGEENCGMCVLRYLAQKLKFTTKEQNSSKPLARVLEGVLDQQQKLFFPFCLWPNFPPNIAGNIRSELSLGKGFCFFTLWVLNWIFAFDVNMASSASVPSVSGISCSVVHWHWGAWPQCSSVSPLPLWFLKYECPFHICLLLWQQRRKLQDGAELGGLGE